MSMGFREFDMSALDRRAAYRLLNSIVVPRPIAWVSSRSAEGRDNLAPHSFYTVACDAPPMLAFTSIGHKDTLANITATKEYIVHLASHDLMHQVNATGAEQPSHIDEFEDAGLDRTPGLAVAASRVAAAPAAFECRLERIVPLGDCAMIIGEVVHAAVRDDVFTDEKHPNHPSYQELAPVARLGADEWLLPGEPIHLRRPTWGE